MIDSAPLLPPEDPMNSTPDQPHLVMLVGNPITGDSRVVKSARTAAAAGYRVTVVGLLRRNTFLFEDDGEVTYVRLSGGFERHTAWLQDQEEGRGIDRLGLDPTTLDRVRLGIIDERAGRGSLTRGLKPLQVASHQLQRMHQRLAPRLRRAAAPAQGLARRVSHLSLSVRGRLAGGWRRLAPITQDFETLFFDALMELEPDLIHVHDYHPLAAAELYSAYMAAQGRRVPWLYDAHEWMPGSPFLDRYQRAAWLAMEADTIQRADAVLTVSDELALKLQRRHGLSALPLTVANAPLASPHPAPGRRPLREECGIDPEVPLMVYVGGIAERRGVLTCVDALQYLPDAHVAFVAGASPTQRATITDRAAELGLSHRVHILDYVPADSVTWYVSSATIGVSPLLAVVPQHQVALPTKLREYLLAGLPVLVSNMRAQAEWVRHWQVGEVFEQGDAQDLAAKFSAMLPQRERYLDAIDEEFIRTNSWESQEVFLEQAWGRMVPPNPRPAPEPEENPGLRMVASSSATSWLIYQTWGDITGEPIAREVTPSLGDETLAQALQRWKRLTQPGLVLVIAGNAPTFSESFEADVRALSRAGVTVVGVVEPGTSEVVEKVAELVPTHPLLEADPATLDRHRRNTFLVQQRLSDIVTTLTPSRLTARMHPSLEWLPVPVETAPARTEATRRVLVLSAWRSQAEEDAVRQLDVVANEFGYTLEHATAVTLPHAVLRAHDVVIDALNTGEYSPTAAHAMGQGCVVVGGASRFDVDAPVVEADNGSVATVLGQVLLELADDDALARRSSASVAFARDVHAPQHTVDIIRRLQSAPRT